MHTYFHKSFTQISVQIPFIKLKVMQRAKQTVCILCFRVNTSTSYQSKHVVELFHKSMFVYILKNDYSHSDEHLNILDYIFLIGIYYHLPVKQFSDLILHVIHIDYC